MRYFKHMNDMLEDPWVQDVFMAEHGIAGYGFICGIYEIYAKACKENPGDWVSVPMATVTRKLRVSATKVERWLSDCSTTGKLSFEIVLRELRIKIPKMRELMDEWTARKKAKLGSDSGETTTLSRSISKSIREVEVDPPTPLPPLPEKSAAAPGVFFEIKRPSGCYSEKEWLRQQLIECLRTSKRPFDRGATLETVLSFNQNLVGVYRRWLKIPIHRRMAVFVLVTLDKTVLDNQFTYALKVAENENPTPEQAKQIAGYLKRAEKLVEEGIYEVEIDV